jgi:hypothetical protein
MLPAGPIFVNGIRRRWLERGRGCPLGQGWLRKQLVIDLANGRNY